MQKEGEKARAYWSPGGQIYFINGKAFGTTSDSRTIEIGSEDEIQGCLKDNKTTGNKVIDNILKMELEGQVEKPKTRRRKLRRK